MDASPVRVTRPQLSASPLPLSNLLCVVPLPPVALRKGRGWSRSGGRVGRRRSLAGREPLWQQLLIATLPLLSEDALSPQMGSATPNPNPFPHPRGLSCPAWTSLGPGWCKHFHTGMLYTVSSRYADDPVFPAHILTFLQVWYR